VGCSCCSGGGGGCSGGGGGGSGGGGGGGSGGGGLSDTKSEVAAKGPRTSWFFAKPFLVFVLIENETLIGDGEKGGGGGYTKRTDNMKALVLLYLVANWGVS
jgi:hypothetical protein